MEQNSFIKTRKDYYTHKKHSFLKQVKESIFGVIFVLLKDEEAFPLLESVLFIFEFLEFMIFPFNTEIKSVWQNDTLTDTFNSIFSYLSILNYLTNQPAAIYLTGFYASLFSITLVLINIGYVSYSFSRKYFTVTWPLYLLRTVAKIFVTGLFMPLFELNLSIFHCLYDPQKQKWLNSTSTEIICYEGTHFIHMIISVVVTALFILISLFVGLTFFENSEAIGEKTAKENSRADFAIMISKIVSTSISMFFIDSNYQWFLIVINFSFSVFQVVKMVIDRPYYNFNQMGLIVCLNGIYMWSNFMLLVCKILHKYRFEAGFYIWLIGCPILGFFFYCYSDESKRVLSKSVNLCKTGEEVQRHLRYFLTICDHLNQRDENNMTLQGYIYNHNCFDPLCGICELKKLKLTTPSIVKKQLYDYAENIYIKEISRYPNCTSLRLSYAMFLYERKNDKALALQQLSFAEKYNPLFDEEFIIYRYRKMINDENERICHVNSGDQFEEEEELDVVSSIAYDSHFRLCLHNIKRSAELYINFWEKIINSTSQDLGNLNEMAVNINAANKNIEIHWKSMLEIKPNDPKAFKIYGGYICNVLNNKDRGNELMTIGYETSDKKPNSVGYLHFEIDEEYVHLAKEGNSFILCSCEDEKTFGNIIKASKTAMLFFGSSEKEILSNKNIKNLFLDCYNKSIINVIKAELEKNIDTLIQSKQYLLFIKHKSNKPVPVYVIFRRYKGIYLKEKCFAVIFMCDIENRENLKNYIKNNYYIVDQDLKIKYLTQGAIELINKLNRKLPDDYGYFNKLFPEFEFEFEENEDNEEMNLQVSNQYVILNSSYGGKIKSDPLEAYQSEDNKLFLIKLQVIPNNKIAKNKVKSLPIKQHFIYPKINHMLKAKKAEMEEHVLPNLGNNNIANNVHVNPPGLLKKLSNFYEFSQSEKQVNLNYFRNVNHDSDSDSSFDSEYDSKKSDKDEYYDEIKDDVMPLEKNQQNESEAFIHNKHLYEGLSAEEFKKKLETLKNYSKKVTFYLIKIKKNEIEKVDQAVPQIIHIVKDKKHTLTVTDGFQFSRAIDYSKGQPTNYQQKNEVYKSVENLGYYSFIILLVFMGYSIIEFFLVQMAIQNKQNNFEMLNASIDSMQYFQLCGMFLLNLVLVNHPKYTNYNGMEKEEFIKYNHVKIGSYLELLSGIQNNLTVKSQGLLKEQEQLINEKRVAFLATYENGERIKRYYTYLHAFQMQSNLLVSTLPIEPALITIAQNYVYEFLYNNLNDFLVVTLTFVKLYYQLINSNSKNDIINDAIICIVNLAISAFLVVFLYKRISSIEIERTKVLKSFYKIPKFYLKNLSNKSRNFIQKIERYILNSEDEDNQAGEHDDESTASEFSEKDDLDRLNSETSFVSSKSFSKSLSYLPKAILGYLFLLIYFSVSLITNSLSFSNIQILNYNFYLNSFNYVNATLAYNMFRERIVNSNTEVFNSFDSELMNKTFDLFSILQIDIIQANSDSYNYFNTAIITLLQTIQTSDICSIEAINSQIENCDSQLNYISNFGSGILLAEYLEFLRLMLDDVYIAAQLTNNDGKIEILNKESYKRMNILNVEYLRAYSNVLKNNLFVFIENYLSSQINLNSILLGVFSVIVACAFLFFWIPFLYSLKESVRIDIYLIMQYRYFKLKC